MKTWIVSSLHEETIQGEETNQGRKLYEEIRYTEAYYCPKQPTTSTSCSYLIRTAELNAIKDDLKLFTLRVGGSTIYVDKMK